MHGTPVLEVGDQQQGEAYLYFLGKCRPRPSLSPKGLKIEESEQTTQLSRGQSPSTGPKLQEESGVGMAGAKAEVTWACGL